MATVGYFDTSSDSVSQLDAFNDQQCAYIYHDEATLFDNAQEGDVVVVKDLSCAGKDLSAALGFAHRLAEHGLGFVSVGDGLDTRTSGELAAVLEAMYRLVLSQPRTAERPEAASKESASATGHRRSSIAPEVIDEALERYQRGDTIKSICEELGLSQGTLYRYARQRGVTREG